MQFSIESQNSKWNMSLFVKYECQFVRRLWANDGFWNSLNMKCHVYDNHCISFGTIASECIRSVSWGCCRILKRHAFGISLAVYLDWTRLDLWGSPGTGWNTRVELVLYRGSCPSSGGNEHGQLQLTWVENVAKISVCTHAKKKGVPTVFSWWLSCQVMMVLYIRQHVQLYILVKFPSLWIEFVD